jgi:hypothetical protein
LGIFSFFKRLTTAEVVEFDDSSVTRRVGDGRIESVRWDDLVEVAIVTTDQGPLTEDVFWLLIGRGEDTGCAISQGAKGADKLLRKLQELPGFNNDAVIEAMTSTSNNRFTYWQKDDAARVQV